MPGVTSIDNAFNPQPGLNQANRKSSVEMDEFLKLLLTELTNQDPTSPADSQAFASQLAQFTSIEQLSSIDKNIKYGVDVDMVLTQTINNTLAATAIGKEARARGDLVTYDANNEANLSFSLDSDAKNVSIRITDQDGAVVRVIEENGMQRGEHTLSWDGKNNNGTQLPEGEYHFSVEAFDASGNTIPSSTFVIGIINGVRYADGGAVFLIGSQEVAFSSIIEITSYSQG